MKTFLLTSSSAVQPSREKGAGPRRQWGAEVLEIALTLGYFVLLIFTFMEGVRLIYDTTVLDYLSRDAVRYAVVRGRRAGLDSTNNGAPATKYSVEHYVKNEKNKGWLEPLTVTACWGSGGACLESGVVVDDSDPENVVYSNSPGQPFRVTVSHDVFNLFSDVLWLVPANTYSRTAQAKVLY